MIDELDLKTQKQSERFRISDHIGIEWNQIFEDKWVKMEKHDNGIDFTFNNTIQEYSYYNENVKGDSILVSLQFKPFRMKYLINKEEVIEINSNDLLYFENPDIEEDSKLAA